MNARPSMRSLGANLVVSFHKPHCLAFRIFEPKRPRILRIGYASIVIEGEAQGGCNLANYSNDANLTNSDWRLHSIFFIREAICFRTVSTDAFRTVAISSTL